jgi:hypothetical protein
MAITELKGRPVPLTPSFRRVRYRRPPTGANVVAGYAGHEGLATTQFLLTEGTASLALAVVAVVLGRAGPRAAASRLAWLTMGAGLAAAAIGLVQCVPWGPRDCVFRDPSGTMVRISQAPKA